MNRLVCSWVFCPCPWKDFCMHFDGDYMNVNKVELKVMDPPERNYWRIGGGDFYPY